MRFSRYPNRAQVASCLGALVVAVSSTTLAETVQVVVGETGPEFTPSRVTIRPGDTVQWNWGATPAHGASVTSGENGHANGLFDSGLRRAPYSFSYTFTSAGRYPYFCRAMPDMMTGVIEVIGSQPLNISTRLRVQTGENVMIGGFIITGNVPKKVIIRAIGPSLQQAGVSGALADPVMELRSASGALITSNDDWKENQRAEIESTGIPPQNDLESAIVRTLPAGSYTAIVRGKNAGTGVGLVEVYDLDTPADSRLVNISTRGFVETGSNVMIGGFILGNHSAPARVIVRAIGPSLSQAGISGALADPTLELRDTNGELVRSNNNWRDTQQADIQGTGIPPQHDLESAIIADLPPSPYTAVARGVNDTTGVGLVEVYHLQ